MSSGPITPRAMELARVIVEAGAAYYVAGNDTQRTRAVETAARELEPRLREIERAAAITSAANPS